MEKKRPAREAVAAFQARIRALAPAAPRKEGRAELPYRVYERALRLPVDAGARVNVLAAARAVSGLLESRRSFSFWAAVGPLAAFGRCPGCGGLRRGGGTCFVASALFEMAAHLGWSIGERFGHPFDDAREPVSAFEPRGLDARVRFPDRDLVLLPSPGLHAIEAWASPSFLHLRADAAEPLPYRTVLVEEERARWRCGSAEGWSNTIVRRRYDVRSEETVEEVIATNDRFVRS